MYPSNDANLYRFSPAILIGYGIWLICYLHSKVRVDLQSYLPDLLSSDNRNPCKIYYQNLRTAIIITHYALSLLIWYDELKKHKRANCYICINLKRIFEENRISKTFYPAHIFLISITQTLVSLCWFWINLKTIILKSATKIYFHWISFIITAINYSFSAFETENIYLSNNYVIYKLW